MLPSFSLHPTKQGESPCCHILLTVLLSYHGKVTPIGALHAEKIAEAVFLYMFRIAFPASLLYGPLSMPVTR